MRSPLTTPSLPLVLAFVLALSPAGPALAAPPDPAPLTADDRRAIVDDLTAALREVYVFPETADEMEELVRRRLAEGAYDGLTDPEALAERLTEDFQSVSGDKHLRVRFDPGPRGGAEGGPTEEERRARFEAMLRADNYCFEKVEHLEGNVGYLRFDCFAPAELGGATAVAAMGFLAGSDALIVDLRNNGGGSPSMIQLLTSYLLEAEPTHLNSFYVRKEDRTDQFWTHAWVPGTRMPDVPVFVLTSPRTFSAAEEFTYNLKALERATIVGETTGGGAHPVQQHQVEGYPLAMSLPFGRAINPVTESNWEGTGVEPHVAVPDGDALEVAHARALAAVAEAADDPRRKAEAEFAGRILEDRRHPAELSPADLEEYTGTFGPRVIASEGGTLHYRRGDGPPRELTPVGDDRFLVGDSLSFRVRFERDESGQVTRIVGLYADGREEPHERSGS